MELKLFALLLAGFIICELNVGYVGAKSEEKCENRKFENKVIIVTGASSGIGADAAKHLAKLGASLSLVGRNMSRLNAVYDEIVNAGATTPLKIVADITKDAKRIVDKTVNHFGQLDVLINNAGIMVAANAENVDLIDFDLIWHTNVRAPLELTKYSIPHLSKTKGNVLNIASIDG
ncbi:11-beta-hydroxysteroid dehydrogenase-like 4A, partial [Contarinia nasturtii]|uniref:11-beta-hydroxysteroid dehydrogenase-like 4A n=1 Tax=Contarinia nasturtii TaxID=265458 RepID=UPI0012D47882